MGGDMSATPATPPPSLRACEIYLEVYGSVAYFHVTLLNIESK